MSNKKSINVGTLFSGIGAFEHALNQLQLPHQILFACDNGERELPLTYEDLKSLTEGLSDNQLYAFCEDYINHIGVKREYRDVEISILYKLAHEIDCHSLNSPVVVEFSKIGRKSPVKHKLTITQDQINQLTPNMNMKEREQYVNSRYASMGEHNYVKDAYMANYPIKEEQWHEDIRFLDAREFEGKLDILVGGSPCQSFSNYGKKLGLEDVRGTLFYDYARVIKEAKPKIFMKYVSKTELRVEAYLW